MDKIEVLAFLDARGIEYVKFEHRAVFTVEEADTLHLPHPEAHAKNLFLRDAKKRNYYLVTLRENRKIDLRAFAGHHGLKPLSFASEADLQQYLGLEKGSVTPLGLLNDTGCRVRFFMDSDFDGGSVYVHPNENTASLYLKARDLMDLISASGHSASFVSFE